MVKSIRLDEIIINPENVSKEKRTEKMLDLSSQIDGYRKIDEFIVNCTKILTYPTLGNLSVSVRERIEKSLGRKFFDANLASLASSIVNPFIYLILPFKGYACNDQSGEKIMLLATIGAVYGIMEAFARDCLLRKINYKKMEHYKKKFPYTTKMFKVSDKDVGYEDCADRYSTSSGSLIGKIISIPLELMLILYDKTKSKYLK